MRIGKVALVTALLGVFAAGASAAEPIEGKWKNGTAETIAISPCGDGFCLTMTSGDYACQSIGKLKGKDMDYAGQITDPESKKTYSGTGKVEGKVLKLKGCALRIFCRTESWDRL